MHNSNSILLTQEETFKKSLQRSNELEESILQATPLPLQREIAEAKPFPLEALGPILGEAAKKERGLLEDSIRKFCIGWNDRSFYERAESFGLKSQNSASNKVYLDRGFVLPSFRDKILTKAKIRRADWHQNAQISKYYEIKGSMAVPSLFDYSPERPCLIVEAEFDAMLISQSAGNICCTVALGGASKKPDLMTHQLLLKSSLILFSLDFDEAGKKAFRFWKETYPNLYAWPVPKEKGPCDALKAGVDLKAWVLAGIEHFQTIS